MRDTPPHPKALEEIEWTCVPGLVEVLRTEGVEGVRYALWNIHEKGRSPRREPRPGDG